MRVADLVRFARSPLEVLAHFLGDPSGLLVGSTPSRSRAAREVSTRSTRNGPGLLVDASEFARQRVYVLPQVPAGVPIRIGRGPDNDVVIEDGSISKTHIHLLPIPPDSFRVRDQRSRNGTFIDGALVLPGAEARIAGGQALQLGSRVFRLYQPARFHRILSQVVLPEERE